ncbi:hypothetical protein GLOIN_2v1765053 [Rhizophagus clarus]|uniref:Uncharacterized protein n=1 Tax=Rhizophagus clarus TaxID=94130 RepID=A0A8H3LY71_9GLOM|nr:hypothetical protein GLOIN_2v1765053 [Rhizophagus clarus]
MEAIWYLIPLSDPTEDSAPKRIVETRRISNQSLCVDHLTIIPETYQYQEDLLAMFEDIKDQISDVYRRELAHLGGIKVKIVLIAHMYRFDQIDQTVLRQYNKILDKINEMNQNQNSGWIYKYGKKIFLEISAYQPLRDERYFEACMKVYLANEEAYFTGIAFPATLQNINLFEEKNPNYVVNVFYLASPKNDKEQLTRNLDPLCISEYNYQRENVVDLILFTEGEKDLRDRCNINDIPEGLNTHYCLINGKNE